MEKDDIDAPAIRRAVVKICEWSYASAIFIGTDVKKKKKMM